MDFVFAHDGLTFGKHSECGEGEVTEIRFEQLTRAPVEEPPLEPSGDDE